jgi:hypothetical protein
VAQNRRPTTGRFANVAPAGAAASTPPGMPEPGLEGQPSPIAPLSFTPTPSLIQGLIDGTAVSSPPGMAGPCPVMPTTPFQDLSNQPFAGDQDAAGSPA